MATYVVDVNVVPKWRLPEVLADQARVVRTKPDTSLLAPRFLSIEASNVLALKAAGGEISSEDALEFLAGIPSLVRFVDDGQLLRAAFDISIRHHSSVYDSLYLALALREGSKFITADERFIRVMEPVFPNSLLWLGDVTADSL